MIFGIKLLPPSYIGVANSGGGGRVLGEFRSREGGACVGWGIGADPPNARDGQGEGRIFLVEGESVNKLTVGREGHS